MPFWIVLLFWSALPLQMCSSAGSSSVTAVKKGRNLHFFFIILKDMGCRVAHAETDG